MRKLFLPLIAFSILLVPVGTQNAFAGTPNLNDFVCLANLTGDQEVIEPPVVTRASGSAILELNQEQDRLTIEISRRTLPSRAAVPKANSERARVWCVPLPTWGRWPSFVKKARTSPMS